MSNWISVKERLPKTYVSVLVYIPNEKPFPTVREGFYAGDKKGWYAFCHDEKHDDVTHWMPMPEPPEEDNA